MGYSVKECFEFNGIDSRAFGAFVASYNYFDAPQRSTEKISVPGRNGDLIIDNGKYENFQLSLRVFIPESAKHGLNQLKHWLMSVRGYKRLVLSGDPDHYRLAEFSNAFEIGGFDGRGGYIDLEFNCKPQKYLVSGDRAVTLTKSGALHNPTFFDAKPLIRVYGTGRLMVSDQIIDITSNPGEYIDIDSELGDAYEGTNNRNSCINLTDFPVLPSGDCNVSLGSGITKIIIKARWWEL